MFSLTVVTTEVSFQVIDISDVLECGATVGDAIWKGNKNSV
jgi:hypothetical protein